MREMIDAFLKSNIFMVSLSFLMVLDMSRPPICKSRAGISNGNDSDNAIADNIPQL